MEKTAKGRQESKRGKKKTKTICRKAAQVFNSKGYRKATLINVSCAAGLSKGGIYHYFSTKKELLFTILDSAHPQMVFLPNLCVMLKK